jgi:hypothetical protein
MNLNEYTNANNNGNQGTNKFQYMESGDLNQFGNIINTLHYLYITQAKIENCLYQAEYLYLPPKKIRRYGPPSNSIYNYLNLTISIKLEKMK